MTINLDLSGFEQLLLLPPGTVLWRIFWWYFGWFPVAIVIIKGILDVWLKYRKTKWEAKHKFIMLAIDIPRNNAQSPRAVENMFTYFAGAHKTLNLIEKWWQGVFQLGFSFEIVSIGGFIQFLIRTPIQFRNLVESAVYSQYPDAEIYEVEDYTAFAPKNYPDSEYDLWGAEFIQTAPQVLPIRVYTEFEHQFGDPETHYRDPMASLMDLMSSLQKGEQLWYQIVVIPTGEEWKVDRDKFVGKMLKEKQPATKANAYVDKIIAWMGDVSEQIYRLWGDIADKPKKEDDPLKMMNLKPNQKAKIEAADRKISKIGFECTIRAVYISRKEVMNKPKAVNGFVGFIKQFNTGDLNSLKPDMKVTATSTQYFFADKRLERRKEKIIYAYRERSDMRGRRPWILNTEELATLWHFPIDAVVKAPLVQRAGARRIEPPMALPTDEGLSKASAKREPIFDEDFVIEENDQIENQVVEESPEIKKNKVPKFMDEDDDSSPRGAPPVNLPFAD